MNIYISLKFPEGVFVDYMSVTASVCFNMRVNMYENIVLLVTYNFSAVIQLFNIIIIIIC